MPIAPTDLQRRLTVVTGPGDANASTPPGSLGGFASTTALVNGALSNLFDTITGTENQLGDVEYRAFMAYNAHPTLSWTSVVAWILSETPSGAIVAIGADPTAPSDIDSAVAQAVTIANENTAPAGVVFSAPTTKGAAVALGTIPPDGVRCLWVRRTAQDTPAQALDGVVIRVEGDTGA